MTHFVVEVTCNFTGLNFFISLKLSISENIDSFAYGLWTVHWAANLLLTNKELHHCYSVLLTHFMNNYLTEIVVKI